MGRLTGRRGPDKSSTIVASGFPAFLWTDQRFQAARLLGEGDLTEEEIGRRCGCSDRTLYNWKQHPTFMDRVRAAAVESESAAVSRGYGRKGRRVSALSYHAGLLEKIVAERGTDYATTHPDVPGATTGLLVYEETVLKTSISNDRKRGVYKTEELVSRKWAVDAALIREHRGLLMQISREVGGIVDRSLNLNVNVDGNGTEGEPPADLGSLSRTLLGRIVPQDGREGTATTPPPSLPE